MKKMFRFGEQVKGYDVPVLNEREARAAAGILFLFAMISFMNALLIQNFIPLKIFVTFFFIDFFIRVIINPMYSPTLIFGRLFISNQTVEYTGAPQKRFAWSLGLGLSIIMFVIVVLLDHRGWLNLGVCLFCLVLLFFEAAFGICIGCKMYNTLKKRQAQYCPGGVCEIKRKEPIQRIAPAHIIILSTFLLAAAITTYLFL